MGHPMDSEIDKALREEAVEAERKREEEKQRVKHRIAKVLDENESLCLDDADDKARLLAALMEVL